MIPTLPRPLAVRLLLIRTALLAGVLLFGAVTWYMQRQNIPIPLPPDRATLHGYVFIGLAVTALVALFGLRRRLESGVAAEAALQTYIIGYAMAEGAALFGAVTWFIGGNQNWYVAGVVLMVVAFQILPIRR